VTIQYKVIHIGNISSVVTSARPAHTIRQTASTDNPACSGEPWGTDIIASRPGQGPQGIINVSNSSVNSAAIYFEDVLLKYRISHRSVRIRSRNSTLSTRSSLSTRVSHLNFHTILDQSCNDKIPNHPGYREPARMPSYLKKGSRHFVKLTYQIPTISDKGLQHWLVMSFCSIKGVLIVGVYVPSFETQGNKCN
jgi:hypothetical protein